jgi:TolB-like protein
MMNRFSAAIIASALLMLVTVGCDGTLPVAAPEPVSADIVGSSHMAADAMADHSANALDQSKPLIAATFVNIDDLSQASSFGRIVSEQVASRFTDRGFKVVEMLLRNDVYIQQKGGEFLLSRELKNISSKHDAQAVIVGTYAMGRKNVYVTAKLIRANDNIVLASYDYSLPMDPDVAFMLRGR